VKWSLIVSLEELDLESLQSIDTNNYEMQRIDLKPAQLGEKVCQFER
jgi:hypothetical protein